MSDPAILFLRPGAISTKDRTALRKAGVLVVEIDDPSSVKFVRAHAEVSGTDMIIAAMKGVKAGGYSAYEAFTKAIAAAIIEPVPTQGDQDK